MKCVRGQLVDFNAPTDI